MQTFRKSYVIDFRLERVFSKWVAEDTVVSRAERMEVEPRIGEVAVTFQPHPDGTEVNITHSGFKSSTSYDSHASGWDNYIDGFTAHLRSSA